MLRWMIPLAGALVLLVILLEVRTDHVRFAGQLAAAHDSSIVFGATDSVPGRRGSSTAIARLQRSRSVQIQYPRTMRSDESGVVQLKYALIIDSTGVPDPKTLPSRKKSVTLSGANFAVKPEETRPLAWHGHDTATIVWSVLPAHPGSHNLVIDASSLYEGEAVHVSVLDMRGNQLRQLAAENVVLPVDVFTEWGVSEPTARIGKGALGLLTFVLTFVGFAQLREWLRRPRGEPAVAPIPPADARRGGGGVPE